MSKVFHRWTVISEALPKLSPNGDKVTMVNAKCECGTVARIDPRTLYRGMSKSCGCLRDEIMRERWLKFHAKRKQLNQVTK